MEIILKRLNQNVHFEATNADGSTVHIDGSPAIGGEGKGMRPMELLLTAVASCSVFDIVSILQKQREPLEDVQISARGKRGEGADVKPFTEIKLVFTLKGALNQEKARRAVSLAVEKYCSVGASLDPNIPVSWDVVFED
ncbi:MAG: OsmC family protein [Candidatus Cyclonatronum sp.]|uniref:OsmC family protein n=1 Tax=Cyclonatronum sp. TaxID=3024185 RepID=UPI0025C077E8|nr:OsmC family protein [Cyclonatronum sp.]MCC5933897.1 OsmC family protein [Balneolales bacterium]MCH8486305.1 OsmC family protein [Cyclonatronum sp.]